MSTLRSTILRAGTRVERNFDRLRRSAKRRLGLADPVTIQPFRGDGDHQQLRLRGRVLEVEGLQAPEPGDSVWKNLHRMLRRYESDEIPGARVRASFAGRQVEVEADEEGFIDIELEVDLEPDPPPAERWRAVELELCEPLREGQAPVRVTGWVLTPPRSAEYGVISDVDDTIVETGATNVLRHWRTVLFNNAISRTPFPGLAAFYRALERDARGRPIKPIFYVSSSPWNIFDLFERFMEAHDIPVGPMVFKDFGLDRTKFLKGGHRGHKLEAIELILSRYPHLPFILIGDSGQRDVEIYRSVVERYPGRVLAVYIRDVSRDARDRTTRDILATMREHGVQTAFGPTLMEAAANAATHGWIDYPAVAEVQREVDAARDASAR